MQDYLGLFVWRPELSGNTMCIAGNRENRKKQPYVFHDYDSHICSVTSSQIFRVKHRINSGLTKVCFMTPNGKNLWSAVLGLPVCLHICPHTQSVTLAQRYSLYIWYVQVFSDYFNSDPLVSMVLDDPIGDMVFYTRVFFLYFCL